MGDSPWGHEELDTTEQLTLITDLLFLDSLSFVPTFHHFP